MKVCYQIAHNADAPTPPLLDPADITSVDIKKELSQNISEIELSENLSYLVDTGYLTHTELLVDTWLHVYKITSDGKKYFEEETDIWGKIMRFFNQNLIASITAAVITAVATTYLTNMLL